MLVKRLQRPVITVNDQRRQQRQLVTTDTPFDKCTGNVLQLELPGPKPTPECLRALRWTAVLLADIAQILGPVAEVFQTIKGLNQQRQALRLMSRAQCQ
ncbi:hypothetical protein D3C81_1658360 [compost metagenome]